MISKHRLNKISNSINQKVDKNYTYSTDTIAEYLMLQIKRKDTRTIEKYCSDKFNETNDKKYLRNVPLLPEYSDYPLYELFLARIILEEENSNQSKIF